VSGSGEGAPEPTGDDAVTRTMTTDPVADEGPGATPTAEAEDAGLNDPVTAPVAAEEGAIAAGSEGAAAEATPPAEPASTAPVATKKRRAPRAKAGGDVADGQARKLSALDAAVRVLAEAGRPMGCKEMIAAMADKGYWTSPGGKTPWATLYSALLREISTKGKDARFKKTERGKFSANS
jgi:hypothetical protein